MDSDPCHRRYDDPGRPGDDRTAVRVIRTTSQINAAPMTRQPVSLTVNPVPSPYSWNRDVHR